MPLWNAVMVTHTVYTSHHSTCITSGMQDIAGQARVKCMHVQICIHAWKFCCTVESYPHSQSAAQLEKQGGLSFLTCNRQTAKRSEQECALFNHLQCIYMYTLDINLQDPLPFNRTASASEGKVGRGTGTRLVEEVFLTLLKCYYACASWQIDYRKPLSLMGNKDLGS